jgi:hypothetical protein
MYTEGFNTYANDDSILNKIRNLKIRARKLREAEIGSDDDTIVY